MRMIWARRKSSPLPSVDRMHFVMWDFLRMFLASVICGLAVSLVAAGIALVLAHDAFASETLKHVNSAGSASERRATDTGTETRPYPGVLMISSGCDADAVDAVERDWKVTVKGKQIDVRVMQTFVVPAGDATAGTFNASLPGGARLLRLHVHTTGNVLIGKIFDAKSYDQLTAADFRDHSRNGMLTVQNDDGAISTDAIVNIAATEAVTIEYTYRMATDDSQVPQYLFLTLANDNTPFDHAAGNPPTSGTVWVEWVGRHPRRMTQVPNGAFLETVGTKITGLSWIIRPSNFGAPFQLAWSM